MTNDEIVIEFCKKHKLCRGCKFHGNECVAAPDEISLIGQDGKFNDKFKKRMDALILQETGKVA